MKRYAILYHFWRNITQLSLTSILRQSSLRRFQLHRKCIILRLAVMGYVHRFDVILHDFFFAVWVAAQCVNVILVQCGLCEWKYVSSVPGVRASVRECEIFLCECDEKSCQAALQIKMWPQKNKYCHIFSNPACRYFLISGCYGTFGKCVNDKFH